MQIRRMNAVAGYFSYAIRLFFYVIEGYNKNLDAAVIKTIKFLHFH